MSQTSVHSAEVPILCLDIKNNSSMLPQRLQNLLEAADIKTMHDALAVALHVLTLELDFYPTTVDSNNNEAQMPDGWKRADMYQIHYQHLSCPNIVCVITGVLMGPCLIIYGSAGGEPCSTLQIHTSTFIDEDAVKNGSPIVFINMKELSQFYKDSLVLKVLAAAQEAAGIGPTFGLTAMMTEIKMCILSYLKAKDLARMSCVNQEFHHLADNPKLWKKLVFSRYPEVEVEGDETNWKDLYKQEYNRRKQRRLALHRNRHPRGNPFLPQSPRPNPFLPPYPFPQGNIGIPDEIREVFPQLGNRIRPRFNPFPGFPPFM